VRVTYHTFGCKANQYDTEQMRRAIEAVGAETVAGDESPDVWVVNTCTVTNQADADARRFIRRIKRQDPDARIVVAGCSAALKESQYRAMPGVADVIPGHGAEAVANALFGLGGPTRLGHSVAPTVGDLHPPLVQLTARNTPSAAAVEAIGRPLPFRRLGRTRGWLKVQDGCDRLCSFCATRLARGSSRSRRAPDVVAEARMLAEHHPEIVITGIHIGHYGRDLEGDDASTLSRLVGQLLEALPVTRFRLGSIEATEVDDRLIELLRTSGGQLAPHLHMPLQSGADPVLRRMRRWHTREAYRSRTLQIADSVPRLGLGADVITGFPGETPEDHADTRALIEELPFTYLHVFPYSPREDTVAADLPSPVPQRVAGERAREFRDLAHEKGLSYIGRRVGETVEVVPEGGTSGLTEDYIRVDVRRPVLARDSATRAPILVRATLQRDSRGPYIEADPETAALLSNP